MPHFSTTEQKRNAATAAVEYVENKMVVGLGTGSTVEFALRLLSQRVKQGLHITGVPSSLATARLARRLRIPLVPDDGAFKKIDLTIDGADEVDPKLHLIKGGGGALTREKIVAARSDRVIIIVDEKKLVPQLGKLPLPVEVLPFGWQSTAALLRTLGARIQVRQNEDKIFRSDNGNIILDCHFRRITDAPALAAQIKSIAGVVEVGLFIRLADLVIVGKKEGGVAGLWAA
ncbi:ribose-5-phosphate isomerase RpiA [candidate division KSB1 bacterium]|nr:ribose-5-phosphate isomerase RpiA [candidate division KSB1 bacterium]